MESSNRLIAEFMGFTLVDDTKGNCFLAPKGWDILMMDDGNGNSDFNYNKSWDWLMPVIIKMSDIKGDTHYTLYRSISRAYDEAVEFINQHNKGL